MGIQQTIGSEKDLQSFFELDTASSKKITDILINLDMSDLDFDLLIRLEEKLKILNLETFVNVHLRSCRLSSLSNESLEIFFNLLKKQRIQTLIIEDECFSEFDKAQFEMMEIIGQFPALKKVGLKNIRCARLNTTRFNNHFCKFLEKLKGISELSFTHNVISNLKDWQVKSICKVFEQFKFLKKLDVSNNDLVHVDSNLLEQLFNAWFTKELKELNLSGNSLNNGVNNVNLEQIWGPIRRCQALEILDLGANMLGGYVINESPFENDGITVKIFRDFLSNCTKIRLLYLNDNRLNLLNSNSQKLIGAEVAKFKKIESYSLANNGLEISEIFNFAPKSGLEMLQDLNLSNNRIAQGTQLFELLDNLGVYRSLLSLDISKDYYGYTSSAPTNQNYRVTLSNLSNTLQTISMNGYAIPSNYMTYMNKFFTKCNMLFSINIDCRTQHGAALVSKATIIAKNHKTDFFNQALPAAQGLHSLALEWQQKNYGRSFIPKLNVIKPYYLPPEIRKIIWEYVFPKGSEKFWKLIDDSVYKAYANPNRTGRMINTTAVVEAPKNKKRAVQTPVPILSSLSSSTSTSAPSSTTVSTTTSTTTTNNNYGISAPQTNSFANNNHYITTQNNSLLFSQKPSSTTGSTTTSTTTTNNNYRINAPQTNNFANNNHYIKLESQQQQELTPLDSVSSTTTNNNVSSSRTKDDDKSDSDNDYSSSSSNILPKKRHAPR